jgi:hypothetical protein
MTPLLMYQTDKKEDAANDGYHARNEKYARKHVLWYIGAVRMKHARKKYVVLIRTPEPCCRDMRRMVMGPNNKGDRWRDGAVCTRKARI